MMDSVRILLGMEAYRVFEATTIFKHKDTGKYRVAQSTSWFWAKSQAEAHEFAMRIYKRINDLPEYLETVSISLRKIDLVIVPNPETVRLLKLGEPFEFRLDKPGLFISKWGY